MPDPTPAPSSPTGGPGIPGAPEAPSSANAAGAPDSPSAPTMSANVVAYVARLARLDLSPDDLARFTSQLAGIMAHFHDIDALDLAGVEPMTQPIQLVNVLRDDEMRPSLDRGEVLAVAPASADGRFEVPPILGAPE